MGKLSENSFHQLVLEQIERFEEYDGLPTTRMNIPFSKYKETHPLEINSTVYYQTCLIISTVKKVVLFNHYWLNSTVE